MKLRITALTLLLLLATACNKPNSNQPQSDNSAQPTADNSQQAANNTPQQPVAPPAPRIVTVPAGKVLTITLADAVGSKVSQPGQTFGGTLAKPVEVEGETAIPAGAKVEGTVVDAKPLGRFKGGAVLELQLNSVHVHGKDLPVQTAMVTETLKGKGKRTGVLTGGGAGLGAIIGGIAGGGKGAAIGALAGAGAGGAGSAFTGNKEILLPTESAVAFTLKEAIKVRK
jgi:hypothetical protein